MSRSPVLAIVAHADDETIGAGGALARHADEGDAVYLLVLADGERSRLQADDASLGERQQLCRQAAETLGIRDVFFESFPDNAMDGMARLPIAQACERHIEKLKPQTIYTHHGGDVNIDHTYTSDAVTIAARAQPHCPVRRVLHFETASSTEWQLPASHHPFCPNWFVDISAYWEQKLGALNSYEREMRSFPHTRSIDALDALSRWRGASVGCQRAEAFMLVRSIE